MLSAMKYKIQSSAVSSHCPHAENPEARYIRFSQFIMAPKATRMDFVVGSEANCAGTPNRWQPLRDAVFALHNINPVPAREQEKTRISVMDSFLDERGMANTDELLHELRKRCTDSCVATD